MRTELIDEVKEQLANGQFPEIHVARHAIGVTPGDERDPEWRYVDKKGHVHQYTASGDVTSVKWIQEAPATDEYPELGHYECKRCGEVVLPGRHIVTTRQYIAGLVECTVNGESVTQEECKAIFALVEGQERK